MKPWLRKLTFTSHVTSSLGWLGATWAYLALAVVGLTTGDVPLARDRALATSSPRA